MTLYFFYIFIFKSVSQERVLSNVKPEYPPHLGPGTYDPPSDFDICKINPSNSIRGQTAFLSRGRPDLITSDGKALLKCPLGQNPNVGPGVYEEMDTIAYNTTNIYRRNAIRAQRNDMSCESCELMDALGETKPNFPIKRCYSSRPRDVKLTPQQIEDDIEMVRELPEYPKPEED